MTEGQHFETWQQKFFAIFSHSLDVFILHTFQESSTQINNHSKEIEARKGFILRELFPVPSQIIIGIIIYHDLLTAVAVTSKINNTVKVKIKDISVGQRKREVNLHKVQQLSESIRNIGLLNPITISPNFELVAGLHRLEATKLLGLRTIDAVIKDYNEVKRHVAEIDENLIRNNFNVLEQGEMLLLRDELLSSVGLRAKSGDNQWKNGVANSAIPRTNKDISREMDISDRTIRERKQIARGILPEVREQIRNTRYADNAHGLMQLTRQPDYIQKIAVQKILSSEASRAIKIDVNEPNIIKMAIQQAHRDHNLRKFRSKSKNFRIPESMTLHCGDFRKICMEMQPDSCDLILCDPLYAQKAVGLYRDLGNVAMRVLKPSAFFICYVGTMYLPDVLNHLMESGLKYYWQGTIKFSKGRNTEWNRRVWSNVRYFVIFYKEPMNRKAKFFEDFLISPRPEKQYHMYQQTIDIFTYLISRFSKVGDVVLDPVSGAGTTVLASLLEKRKCIGIDIDPQAIKVTKVRISEHLQDK